LSIERHFTLKLRILKFKNTQKLRKNFLKTRNSCVFHLRLSENSDKPKKVCLERNLTF